MKYLVVVNENYYPSVYEFYNEDEAKEKYDSLVKALNLRYAGVSKSLIEDKAIYFCEIKDWMEVRREN